MCRLKEEMERRAPVKLVCYPITEKTFRCATNSYDDSIRKGRSGFLFFFFASFSYRRPQPLELFNESYRVYDARESCSCLRSARLINRVITLIATRFVGGGGPWERTQASIAGTRTRNVKINAHALSTTLLRL